jgi:hypothetical protein
MLLRALIAGSFLLGLPVTGCLSGQTGSPGACAFASCVCDGGIALRVHVDLHEGDRIEATVVEAYGRLGSVGLLSVGAGEKVGGSVLWAKPCESMPTSPELAGADLLVSYQFGADEWSIPSCQQADTCNAECELTAEPESLGACRAACQTSTEMVCRQQALLDGFFGWAVAYADPLDLGRPIPLSRVAKFPSDCLILFPAPPCGAEGAGTCSLSAAPRSSADASLLAWGWSFVWGGSLLWAWTRRRRFRIR